MEKNNEFYMTEAIKEATKALECDEVPIGCIIVHKGKIIARSYNQIELLKDATAHAEMLALTQASATLGNWRLDECTLYVTKEPCIMCFGAILHSRISSIVVGCLDDQQRGIRDLIHPGYEPLLKKLSVEYGCLEQPCQLLLQEFFQKARNREKKK